MAAKTLRRLRGDVIFSSEMNQANSHFALRHRHSRRFGALLCLALFITLQLFASSGPLHKAIHADADTPGHHCVVTLLTHGQVNAPVLAGIWLAFAAAVVFLLPLIRSAVLPSSDLRLAPGRAPPFI